MSAINHRMLEIGDWVKGKTENEALIHGYIEDFRLPTQIKIKVIASDQQAIIGSTIQLEAKHVHHAPSFDIDTEGQIHNLIDMALASKDEQWFHELSKTLQSMKEHEQDKNAVKN